MKKLFTFLGCVAALGLTSCEPKMSGNPIFEGWYADPHAMIYGDTYWVYPTNSLAFHEQIVSRRKTSLIGLVTRRY